MSSKVGHRQLDLPEAQLLSDLYGIIRDLQTVSEFCHRLVDAWDADPIDNYLIDALSTAAVVRYCRCFEGGVRAKIDRDSVGSVDPRFTEFHDYLFTLRQKHLQHSVNDFENNCVAVSVAEPPSSPELMDVCVVGGRVAGLDRRTALNLQELARKLADAADSKYDSEKRQLVEVVEGIPLEDLYRLPEPTAFEPDWRRAIKKRRRR